MYPARQLQDVFSPPATVLAPPSHSPAAINTPPKIVTTSNNQHTTDPVYWQQTPSYSTVVSNGDNVSNTVTTDIVYRFQDAEVQPLSNRLQDLISKFSTYQTVVDLLTTKCNTLSTQYIDIQSDMTTLSQEQATLQTSTVHLHTDISSQMSTLQSTMSSQMNKQIPNITSMLQQLFTQPPNPTHLPDGHGASQVDD
jgi:hypothetical protein